MRIRLARRIASKSSRRSCTQRLSGLLVRVDVVGNCGSEKRKGQGIKTRDWRQMQGIYENPEQKEEYMSGHQPEIADDGGG